MNFLEVYSEAGMIGVVGALLVYMVFSMNKRGSAQEESLQDLKTVIKLIDRWNKSDERLDRKFDDLNKQINDLDNQVSEIKGVISRLNGKH
jgi:septal ring factor EnvC (AmiA/AmiB activator)